MYASHVAYPLSFCILQAQHDKRGQLDSLHIEYEQASCRSPLRPILQLWVLLIDVICHGTQFPLVAHLFMIDIIIAVTDNDLEGTSHASSP